MRCDICIKFEGCEPLREFKHIIDKMEIEEYLIYSTNSLREDLYITIAKFCAMYEEEI